MKQLTSLLPENTDFKTCSRATNNGKWETANNFQDEVADAKRRGFTLEQCAEILEK